MAAKYEGPAEALATYEQVVLAITGEKRKGAKNPYTSANGNMYSFLDADGVICVRLSEEDASAFADKFSAEPVMQHGSVMREYVALPAAVFKDSAALADWFSKSVAYSRTLKPKATKSRAPKK